MGVARVLSWPQTWLHDLLDQTGLSAAIIGPGLKWAGLN